MSADNGVYIGRFTDGLRVIEAQAIDNCYEHEGEDPKLTEAYRVSYFGRAFVYTDADEAWKEAQRRYHRVMEDCGICEYGVSELDFKSPLWQNFKTVEEANEYLDNYWKSQGKG